MRSRRTVEDWRRVVFRHHVTAKAKVYLLFLADHMRADRTVSMPRRTVAAALGCHERRIDDWNTAARKAGLLDVVTPGRKHVTAVYVGLFPEALSATESSALRDAKTQRAETPESASQRASRVSHQSKRPTTGYAVGDLPDEAREERSA